MLSFRKCYYFLQRIPKTILNCTGICSSGTPPISQHNVFNQEKPNWEEKERGPNLGSGIPPRDLNNGLHQGRPNWDRYKSGGIHSSGIPPRGQDNRPNQVKPYWDRYENGEGILGSGIPPRNQHNGLNQGTSNWGGYPSRAVHGSMMSPRGEWNGACPSDKSVCTYLIWNIWTFVYCMACKF